jgi:hypothetical protein
MVDLEKVNLNNYDQKALVDILFKSTFWKLTISHAPNILQLWNKLVNKAFFTLPNIRKEGYC